MRVVGVIVMWRVGGCVVQRWVMGLRWKPAWVGVFMPGNGVFEGIGGGLFVLVGNLME